MGRISSAKITTAASSILEQLDMINSFKKRRKKMTSWKDRDKTESSNRYLGRNTVGRRCLHTEVKILLVCMMDGPSLGNS